MTTTIHRRDLHHLGMRKHSRGVGVSFGCKSAGHPKRSTSSAAVIAEIKEMEATDGEVIIREQFQVPEGRILQAAVLSKPLGIELEERNGHIVVDDMVAGGNAAESGLVQVGDVLRAVSARVVKGSAPRDVGGFRRTKSGLFGELVFIPTAGETFETVIAAIQSNRCSECTITLVLERDAQ
eukprot:CAMPEP_0114229902 /NCGR_PEP_ID=MMETSP0058-20121206/3172_1 /TAXON_ID=36894 /ORGANISM="Pyramimonas parkeae, CCMP726" /LENGTH=180 /DNA_ID=CAMNT_0001341043 /DNA_START=12 /DNA_END=554 /DNA_ORIENTATION=+